MIPMIDWLIFSSLLMAVGAYGVLTARNGILVLMSIEVMLNAANVSLVTFSAYSTELHGYPDAMGQIFALASMTVAAAEVAIGLAIFLVLYKRHDSIDVTKINILRW
ncbi:MAG TPA: NADH-quinone oxidoreductase subunit NuoK [Euryarchaeota archaeon]|nr:NADH-quinone oxidoreductase subunit NuoK [Euryarchaeota archaeon]